MSTFDDAFANTIGLEGGFVDNPADPGGATRYGVTERVARKWGYTGPMQDLPLATAQSIAKSEYWDPFQCGQFTPLVAVQVFDIAYNGGDVVRWLQQASGAVVDGVLGPKTITAVNLTNPRVMVMRLLAYRLQYLTDLDIWSNFGRGWARRVAHNLQLGAKS